MALISRGSECLPFPTLERAEVVERAALIAGAARPIGADAQRPLCLSADNEPQSCTVWRSSRRSVVSFQCCHQPDRRYGDEENQSNENHLALMPESFDLLVAAFDLGLSRLDPVKFLLEFPD
jgi:hypothetical protein